MSAPEPSVSKCRSCGAPIQWVATYGGKWMPMNLDGITHFATCPQASDWRKRPTDVAR